MSSTCWEPVRSLEVSHHTHKQQHHTHKQSWTVWEHEPIHLCAFVVFFHNEVNFNKLALLDLFSFLFNLLHTSH